jgi:hypothetical protein
METVSLAFLNINHESIFEENDHVPKAAEFKTFLIEFEVEIGTVRNVVPGSLRGKYVGCACFL